MSTIPDRIVTPEEYLAFERASPERHEYVNGRIYRLGDALEGLAGTSKAHLHIATNLLRELSLQLRGRPCAALGSDLRLSVSETGMYTYPDVTVVCGDAFAGDVHADTASDATVIMEILSPSTERYDRGEKFDHYRTIPSLREYALVAQDRPLVHRFTRQDHFWVLEAVEGLDAVLDLPSIDCRLPLRDVYDRVAPFRDLPPKSPRRVKEPEAAGA
jgi:Uma2 family endonuclease